MKNGAVVDLTEDSDDESKAGVVKTVPSIKPEIVGAVKSLPNHKQESVVKTSDHKQESVGTKKPLKCECTRDIKCLHCCMKRKEQKDKLLKQQQQQQKQQQQQQQQQKHPQSPPPLPQQKPQSPQSQQHATLTTTTTPNNQLRTYSSERVVIPKAEYSDVVITKKRQHPDNTTPQLTSDIKGTVIDADDEFVYVLNGSKVRVVPKVTAMSQKNIADAVKGMKHGNDTKPIPTYMNTDIKPLNQKSDPLQALGLISQNSFGETIEEPGVIINKAPPVDPAVQYYGLIPVMPFYYYENEKQELKPGDLKPGRRAKNGKPLLTTLTADLSMVQGPLPRSSLQCHLCKQTYMDIHSLAHHNCSGIGEWRNELNAKWWKNFKA